MSRGGGGIKIGVSMESQVKPMSFRGLHPLDPRAMMEPPIKIVQIDNSVRNYMRTTPILPSKTGSISWAFKMLKPMSFRHLNPWIPSTRGVESLTLNLLWEWNKLRIHCEYYPPPRFYPHKRVFLGFWIAKIHEASGGSAPRPFPGGWSQWTVYMVWKFIVKLHQIKANQTSIRHHNKHAEKGMKVRTWSKLRPERLGVTVWILSSV